MNVYDFDKTIYKGDSTLDFWRFCLRRNPQIIRYSARQARAVLLLLLGRATTVQMKAAFFSFLEVIADVDRLVASFWTEHHHGFQNWYLEQKRPDDVVISASPEFLLRPACDALGIQSPVATRMDPKSGAISGENCKGEEKVRRFREHFPQADVQAFYSDSLSDTPMAQLAQQAYLVRKGTCLPWPEQELQT